MSNGSEDTPSHQAVPWTRYNFVDQGIPQLIVGADHALHGKPLRKRAARAAQEIPLSGVSQHYEMEIFLGGNRLTRTARRRGARPTPPVAAQEHGRKHGLTVETHGGMCQVNTVTVHTVLSWTAK